MFIDVITKELKKRNISQKELCKATNLSESTFTNWKNGKIPNIESAMIVIKYLNLSADEIYGIRNSELTADEKEFLEQFRKLDEKEKDMIKAAVYTAADSKSYTSDESSSEVG